jgi:hypothetical protein
MTETRRPNEASGKELDTITRTLASELAEYRTETEDGLSAIGQDVVNFRQETSKNKDILNSVTEEKPDDIQGQINVIEG